MNKTYTGFLPYMLLQTLINVHIIPVYVELNFSKLIPHLDNVNCLKYLYLTKENQTVTR